MEWTDMEYRQITVVNIAGMKSPKPRKIDLQSTMEPRSYGYMTYIHYTLPKHRKKIQMKLPTHIHTNFEIFIHLQTFFEYLLCTQVLEIKNKFMTISAPFTPRT